jgi:hypothetical protein
VPAYTPRHAGPIHAVAWEGRNMFERAGDPRVVVHKGPTEISADVLMIYSSRHEFIERARQTVPASVRQRLSEGKTTLVFDASSEGGPFDAKFVGYMHEVMRDLGAPAAHAVHMTQNRDFEAAYRPWCAQHGVAPMTVINYDFYIRWFFQEHEKDGDRSFAARLAAFEAREAAREKRYVCLNFSPRPSKVLFLLKLIQGGVFDRGFISFPGFDRALNTRAVRKPNMIDDLVVFPGFEDMGVALSPYMDDLDAMGPKVLGPARTATGMPNHYKPLSGDMALDEYNRAWFTVITETEIAGTRRVTEKPFKALANFSPLTIVGNLGSLDLIRQFGFRTFDGVFDESYDREPDPRRRFEMVYAEVKRLCELPESEIAEVEAALRETLVFNAHRALVDMPRIYREEIDPQVIDAFLDLRA